MTDRPLRRNNIAFDGRERQPIAYGRISTIRNGIATILSARDGTIEVPVEHVRTANDYQGFETLGPEYEIGGETYRDATFHHMPTLRRIKQHIARREGRDVWAKDRRRTDRRRRRALIAMTRLDEAAGLLD